MKHAYNGLAFIILAMATTRAGPPFVTDDPVPVDYHHGELYLASGISGSNEGFAGTAPHVEVNYGLFHNLQLHMLIPLSFSKLFDGVFTYGPGDIELGIKYRFCSQNIFLPHAGTFPQIELPVGDEDSNLGAGTIQLFLPIWLQWDFEPWTTYGGAGYLLNFSRHQDDFWFAGWELQYDLTSFLTLGAEIFGRIVPATLTDNEVAINIGSIININDTHHILVSAGRNIVGDSGPLLYLTYQLTI